MKKFILLLFIFFCTIQVQAQNYTTQETIEYINGLIKEGYKLMYSNGEIIALGSYYGKDNKEYRNTQKINLNDIGNIRIEDRFVGISVMLECKNQSNCVEYRSNESSKGIFTQDRYFLSVTPKSYNNGEKIINALWYLIEKEKKSLKDNDPFASYSKKSDINVYDLKIGMTKHEVTKIVNTDLIVEYKEQGYEIFKANKKETYFLYFTNGKLSRVDKGVRSPDATIRLETR
jgi:hypothetical protein